MSTIPAEKNLVLSASQVSHKIKRMAYEIYEHNIREKEVLLAGIDGQGYVLAGLLAKELKDISPIGARVIRVSLDKSRPLQSEINLDVPLNELQKKCVIIVDDVLNTGKTLASSMKPFLSTDVKKIEIAVLVNRSHPTFPVKPTYIGYGLATTLTDHVEVVFGKEAGVYLH
jgi:pyrimidine operon attenuation protein/uracil phosphoribosyltransferase